MKIYFVGSHSTGKTALAKSLHERHNIPMVTEVIREVASEWEVSLEDVRTDLHSVNELQREVMERRIDKEKMMDGENFVSDRGMDFMAYTAEYATITDDLFSSQKYNEYIDWMKEDSCIFFVRPHRDLVNDDGFRAELSWESINRIDGMMKFILEMEDFDYVQIDTKIFKDRMKIIESVLDGKI